MKRFAALLSLLLIATLARPGVITAQQVNSSTADRWTVIQQLSPGDPIEIKLNDGTTIKGRFSSASAAKLTYSKDKKENELFRADIFEIYRLVSKSKAKSVLLGLGIGTGAGLGAGAIVGASTAPHESGEAHVPAALGAMIGAGIGTLVGFFMGRGKKRVLIYRGV